MMGKRVVNTRAAHQAAALDTLLRDRGALPVAYPCITIAPPDDPAQLDAALDDLAGGRYDWLVLTSANTVIALAQRLDVLGLSLSSAAFRTAAIGSATAEAAQQLGLTGIDLPDEYVAEALAASLLLEAGARVLLPESAIARPTLADGLTARGAQVEVVMAYQTIQGSGGDNVPRLLAQQQIDAVTFTSSSTVSYFLKRLAQEDGCVECLQTICLACIGSKTAATARELGLTVAVVPAQHTLEAMVAALDAYFR